MPILGIFIDLKFMRLLWHINNIHKWNIACIKGPTHKRSRFILARDRPPELPDKTYNEISHKIKIVHI